MPEGVVGQQAVYTIWENIIRNVKHCKKDSKELIPFHIEIKNDENKEYVEITCWLDLDSQREEELGNKVNEMNEWMGILDKNQKPNMGGTSQNILCAGMVFGVDFIKTEKLQLQKEADKKVMRFELSNNKRIKFCFKIWKGKDIGKYEDIANKKIEEIGPLGRFRIIQLKDKDEKKNLLKNPFFLRHVIYENASDLKGLYQKWIEEWLKDELKNGIKIIIDRINGIFEDSHFNNFKLENGGSEKYEYCFFHGGPPSENCQISQKSKIQIYYHDSDAIGKIIYGILNEEPNDNIYQGLLELLEILETGIEIFDNRLDKLAKKIENKTPKLEELKVWVFPEEEGNLASLKNANKIHFGIFHLSFIELITGKKNDEAIKEFFNNNYSYLKERYKIIIITTGRGRDWWNGLDEELKMKIKFIPIENLESCFDKTLAPKTPSIGVKYALVKTIFGS